MPIVLDVGNPQWLTFVADPSTPQAQAVYNGYTVPVPAGVVIPTSIDSITIAGIVFWGYARQGTNNAEWVMQPQPDPNVTAVNAIPGPGGWVSNSARQVYYDTGLYLLQRGISGADLRPGLLNLYNAAVAEYQARHP
jgi:hypothetical protein